MYKYLKIAWIHNFSNEPKMIYSEIDEQRWELRKVEEFEDGTLASASALQSSPTTKLGKVPVPTLEEIASDSQFKPTEITQREFNAIWSRATHQ